MSQELHTKIERENHELKEEMVLCLMELMKDLDEDSHGSDEAADEGSPNYSWYLPVSI